MARFRHPSKGPDFYAAFFCRFSLATFAPCFPSAVLVDLGKCAIVRFFFAALTALRMFFRAALRCFSLGMVLSFLVAFKVLHRALMGFGLFHR
jgi:hypothetical protein